MSFSNEEIEAGIESLLDTIVYELLIQHDFHEPEMFVTCEPDDHKPNLLVATIWVDSADIGKIIGRDGVLISAIRTLLFAISRKVGKEVKIDILPLKDWTGNTLN